MQLNDDQRRAVETLDGPVLVTAGAGSGKTRLLTERFVRAVSSDAEPEWLPVGADRVAAITFSEKAAGEIETRIRHTLRQRGATARLRELDRGWVSTIHGLCARILRRYALDIGIDPEFSIADAVTVGELQAEAFERAAGSALASEDGSALFGMFSVATVRSAISDLTDVLARNGLPASAIVCEPVPDIDALLARARRYFTEVAEVLAEYAGTKSADNHCAACRGVVEALGGIDDKEPPHLRAEALWNALAGYEAKGKAAAAVADTVAFLKAERDVLGSEAAAVMLASPTRGLADIVARYASEYERLKSERGLLDFGDLQVLTLRLLESRPDVAVALSAEFDLVMVDEFQDTDALQLAIIERLAGRNLCTVGDERQSIYRFRGADVDVYRTHAHAMAASGAQTVSLHENYRSHPEVLAFVNAVFGDELLFGESLVALKPMRAEPESPLLPGGAPRVELLLSPKGDERGANDTRPEAEALAERFAQLRDEHGVPASEMVVLLRSYTHADDYAAALRRKGFATAVQGGSRFLSLPVIRQARAFVSAIANPADEEALTVVLASPIGGLTDDALVRVRHAAEEQRITVWEALGAGVSAQVDEGDSVAIERTRTAIERARSCVGRAALSEVVLRAIEDTGFDLYLLAQGGEGRHDFANLLKLARIADDFECGAAGRSGPAGFCAYLDAKEAIGDVIAPASLPDVANPAVRIMSIHASKGLEFPVVAIPELGAGGRAEQGAYRAAVDRQQVRLAMSLPKGEGTDAGDRRRTPGYLALDATFRAAEQEELKRLLYVGCTRAREMLLLSGTASSVKDGITEKSGPLALVAAPLGLLGVPEPEMDEIRELRGARYRVRTVSPGDSVAPGQGAETVPSQPGVRAWRPAAPATAEGAAPDPPQPVPSRLSYSDFSRFEQCGRRFWAEKVLRIGSLDVPETRSAADARGFGGAFHAVVELTGQDGALPSAERISAIGRYHGLDDTQSGRLSAALSAWCGSSLAARLAACERVRREMPFQVVVGQGEDAFLLVGSLDVIGEAPEAALIVDYKTGVSGEPEELADRYALQARCYALVAMRMGAARVEVRFVRPEVVGADGEPQSVAFDFGAQQARDIEGELTERRHSMRAGDYAPLPAWEPSTCGECKVPSGLCPIAAEGAGRVPRV